MGVCGVDGKAQCFERGCKFVVGEVMFETVAHIRGGGVGDGFAKVDELTREIAEGGALVVGVDKRL